MLDYLQAVGKTVEDDILFNHQVTRVHWTDTAAVQAGEKKWTVHVRSTKDKTESSSTFDAVCVGNGHYTYDHH